MKPFVEQRVNALLKEAEDLAKQSQFKAALEKQLEALRICQGENNKRHDHDLTALCFNLVGFTYNTLGNHAQALDFHKQSLEMRQRLYPEEKFPNGHPDLATSLNNMGHTFRELKDAVTGLDYSEQSLEMWQRLYPEEKFPNGHRDLATSLDNMGLAYLATGNAEKGLHLHAQALEMYLGLLPENHPDVATAINNLGGAHCELGDMQAARFFFEWTLDVILSLVSEEHPDVATALSNVGAANEALGEVEKGLQYALKALSIRQRLFLADHPDVAMSLNNVGMSYQALGDMNKALDYLLASLDMQENLDRLWFFATTDTSSKLVVLDRTASYVDGLLSVLAHAAYRNPSEANRLAGPVYERLVRRRGLERALHQSLQTVRLGDQYPEHRSALQELEDSLREQADLGQELQMADTQVLREHFREQLRQAEEKERSLLIQLNVIPEIRAQEQRQKATAEDVARHLLDGALLEIVRYHRVEFRPEKTGANGQIYFGKPEKREARYAAFLLTPGAMPMRFVDLGEADHIEEALEKYLQLNVGDRSHRTNKEEAIDLGEAEDEEPADEGSSAPSGSALPAKPEDLRTAFREHPFWLPLRAILGGTQELIVAPDGLLNFAPFHRLLPDIPTVRYIVTGSELVIEEKDKPKPLSDTALFLGDPHYGWVAPPTILQGEDFILLRTETPDPTPELTLPLGNRGLRAIDRAARKIERLPGSRLEVKRVASLLGATSLVWEQASAQALRRVAGLRLVYAATHYIFSDEIPEGESVYHHSGLMLAGARSQAQGKPLPEEVKPAVLSAFEIAALDLRGAVVILPACSAARGIVEAGRMVQGLRSALLFAGARTLVLPLWPVDDLATAILMENFMQRLAKGGISVADALSEAPRYLRTAKVSELGTWLNDATDRELADLEQDSKEKLDLGPIQALRKRLKKLRALPDDARPFADERYWAAFVCVGDPDPFATRALK